MIKKLTSALLMVLLTPLGIPFFLWRIGTEWGDMFFALFGDWMSDE